MMVVGFVMASWRQPLDQNGGSQISLFRGCFGAREVLTGDGASSDVQSVVVAQS